MKSVTHNEQTAILFLADNRDVLARQKIGHIWVGGSHKQQENASAFIRVECPAVDKAFSTGVVTDKF